MTTRRKFIQSTAITTAALAGLPVYASAKATDSKPPTRFIFMQRGNGLRPHVMVPTGLTPEQQQLEKKKESFETELSQVELPEWMSTLNKHKQDMAIVQGLSGKMCTVGHHSWCSALGAMSAGPRPSSIKWATVDFELAKMFSSPLEHIEVACFPNDGGDAHGSLNGIGRGYSARDRETPNYAFGSPKIALRELFKSVAKSKEDQVRYELERELLTFVGGQESAGGMGLSQNELRKVTSYSNSIESIRQKNQRIDQMADRLRQHMPQLDAKFLSDEITTYERQAGHTQVLLAALTSGLTNVVNFTVDELGHDYTGVPGLEKTPINMHSVGHNQAFNGVAADEIRRLTEIQHMSLVDTITTHLKSIPEGNGTMFDNTVIFYFPNNGEGHHAHGDEWPFMVLAGKNSKLTLGNRYIRLPYWGKPGHKTLGNWWTTLLNAYGNPIEHFGDVDAGLARFLPNQKGAIQEFLA
jgi:Protein of unknown function (DUF1552)